MRSSNKELDLLIKQVKKELQNLSKTVTPKQKRLLKLVEEIDSLKDKPSISNSNHYDLINSLSSGLIITDKFGTIRKANSTILNFFGLTDKSCAGKNIFEIIKFADESVRKKIETFFKYLSKNKSKQIRVENEPIDSRKNKSIKVNFNLTVLLDFNEKVAGTVWNFGEIINDDKVNVSSNDKQITYSTLVSNLPGFIYRCANDKDWTMEFISEGCKEITGYDPKDFIGNNILAFNEIIHTDFQNQIWKHWQKILKEKKYFEFE